PPQIDALSLHDALPIYGVGGIIPGLENALEGKSKGEQVVVTISPEQAYGTRNDQLIQEVPRKAFQGVQNIQPGMQFRAQGPQGQDRKSTRLNSSHLGIS